MPERLQQHASLYVFLTGTFLGSTLVLSRFGLSQFDAMTYVSLRLLLASLIFLAAYFIFHVRPWPRDGKLWLLAAGYGIINTAVTMTAFTNSMRYQSSGVTALLTTLSPIVTAFLAHLFLKDEPFTRQRFLGALIAFGGAGLLLVRGENGLSQFAHADWRGYAWVFLGIFSNSIGLVYARRFLRDADPFVVTSIRILVASFIVVTFTALTSGIHLEQSQWTGWLALAYAALIGTFLAFLYYLTTVQRFGATVAVQVENVVPIIATVLGVLLLHEMVTIPMLIGMLLIFLGLAVFSRASQTAKTEQAPSLTQTNTP